MKVMRKNKYNQHIAIVGAAMFLLFFTQPLYAFFQNGVEVFRINGPTNDILFGEKVVNAGDLNNDGIDDILVSAPDYTNPAGVPVGKMFAYSGKDGSLLYAVEGEPYGVFGESLSRAGDFNNDGFEDFIVGDSLYYPNGKVYLFSGKDGSPVIPPTPWVGTFSIRMPQFGYSLAYTGDVNKNGLPDVIVGEPGSKAAHVFDIMPNGQKVLIYKFVSPSSWWFADWFGQFVSGAADFNGDGYEDLIVTAPYERYSNGRVYVFSGKDGAELFRLYGTKSSQHMGFDVEAKIGDLDGDSVPDLIVGAPYYTTSSSGVLSLGAVSIYSGRTQQEIYFRAGSRADGTFGHQVGSAGDVDEDGTNDYYVSSPAGIHTQFLSNLPGEVYVYSGKTNQLIQTFTGERDDEFFGLSVSEIDFNRDNIMDLVIGEPLNSEAGMTTGSAIVFTQAMLEASSEEYTFPPSEEGTGPETITINIDAGQKFGSQVFAGVVSLSGSYPGMALPGGAILPLNPDPVLTETTQSGGYITPRFGVLNSEGKGTFTFQLPVGTPRRAIGSDFYIAPIFVDSTTGSFGSTTNAVKIKIVE